VSESGPPRPSRPPPAPTPPGARPRLTPHGSRIDAAETLLGSVDRPARLQMIAALVLGLVLVAIPLYLWRRPRSEAVTVTNEVSDASTPRAVVGDPAAAGGQATGGAGGPAGAHDRTGEPSVALSEARVLECHDAGAKRTAPADCDHLASIEKSFAQAIESSAACVPVAADGGTLVYVVDVSFLRKRNPVTLTLPRDGRALRNAHATLAAVAACTSAVKRGVVALSLDGVPHAHGRYKIAITASYAVAGDGRAAPAPAPR
jgi:hypothetical protein